MSAITKSLCFSFIIFASFATLFTVADAWRFNVGGNGVWDINPLENYKTWAERNRFQVNDTLYFKYAKGSDSVEQVMKADFDGCNVKDPLKTYNDGESVVTLDRSGPFYFISGNQDRCKKGQKLIVVVLAVRNHTTVPISPAHPPSTTQPPRSASPVSPIAPSQPPKAHSPVSPIAPAKPPSMAQPPKSHSPVSPSQSQSPKSSVSPSQPPKSSSPVSHSPALSPSHAPAKSPTTPSPSHAPTQSPVTPSPSPKALSPVSSPSPKASSPVSSPTLTPSSPDQSPTSPSDQNPPISPSPSETTPSDNIKAPAPSPKSSASGLAVTSVMTIAISVVFTFLMFV